MLTSTGPVTPTAYMVLKKRFSNLASSVMFLHFPLQVWVKEVKTETTALYSIPSHKDPSSLCFIPDAMIIRNSSQFWS